MPFRLISIRELHAVDGLEEMLGAGDLGGSGLRRPVEDGRGDGGEFFDDGADCLTEEADQGAPKDEIVEVEDALVAGDELDLAAGVAGERGEGLIGGGLSVKNGNHLGFADELKKLGFDLECTAASGWGDLYKWQPSPSH